jgi:hypothetical protein
MHKQLQCLKKCVKRVKRFAMRSGIVLLAMFAVFVVMYNTGEVVPLALAIERIAEALGFSLADTLAEV